MEADKLGAIDVILEILEKNRKNIEICKQGFGFLSNTTSAKCKNNIQLGYACLALLNILIIISLRSR